MLAPVSGIQMILLGLGLIGMLPLGIILYKRRIVKTILDTGLPAKARVIWVASTDKYATRRQTDVVRYVFYDQYRQQHRGTLTCKIGHYQVNDVIDIYYLPDNPKRNTVPGAWHAKVFIVFGIALAVFVWYAAYKLLEMA